MARKQGSVDPSPGRDEHSAPAGSDLSYIASDLRPLAVDESSLVLDPMNIKDHGEADLPTHAESLRQFGIRRAIVVRRSNRQIEAGNGTLLAAKRNGWQFVPVIFVDDDDRTAKGFALADNAVGTLAGWNEANFAKVQAEVDELFEGDGLRELSAQILKELEGVEADSDDDDPGEESGELNSGDIVIQYRVIAICYDADAQSKLLAELEKRGIECRLSQTRE